MAALTLAASCQNDFDYVPNGEETAQVTFNVGTPEMATRAFSDGTSATKLEYAVYSVGENDALTHLDLDGEKTFSISTDVQLQLTTGNKYAVIFWAAAENAPYTVDFDAKTMTVNYTNAVSNDESRDAFYKYHTFTVSGAQTETVELKRPFAQLNIGTNDYEESASAGYTPAYSYVKVPVSAELNLVDGTVDTAAEVEFKLASIPANEEFPVADYDYLSMNYLLVAADKEVVDVVFGYSTNNTTVEKSRIVGSVPVQRNHRTNIYGQLLTSDVDVNVEIKPGYDDPALPETVEEQLNIAAQLGGTVTLTEDVVLTEPLVISGVQTRAASAIALELDLNGHNITYTSDAAKHSAMITVNAGQKLTIKDSQGTGKITYNYTGAGDPNFGWGTYTIDNNGGTLVVEDATIEIISNLNDATGVKHMYCAIFQYSGSTTINGGTISNSTYRSARLWKGNMTINGGVFEGQLWVQAVDDTAVLTINGGSFAPSGADSSSVFVTNGTYNPTLKVTGGTFETKIGCTDYTKSGVKGSVTGGIFGAAVNTNLLADGYFVNEDGGKYSVNNFISANSTEGLQAALDAAKDGYNINLKAGVSYGVVYMARPTMYNNTTMSCDNHGYTTTDATEFKNHLAEAVWHTTPEYTTTLKNVTIVGAEGATIAGVVTTSGHVYGDNVHDYVLDVDKNGSAYYSTLHLENIKFSNVAFTGTININTSDATSTYNGVTFENCTFTTGGTASSNGPAIRYYNEANNGNVKNIVVKNCKFNNCYQGIYVHHVNGINITENEFDTTGHNAVAMQGHDGAVNLKSVVINNNTFKNIGDRIIRFNNVGADSNITIQYNTATNSGDDNGEVIKATSIEDGAITNIGFNDWGAGAKVNNPELNDAITEATTQEELEAALANGVDTIILPAGAYTMPAASNFTSDTVITCEEGVVFTGTSGLNINGATIVGAEFKNDSGYAVSGTINGTLKDCVFDASEALRWCYTTEGTTTVFENCEIKTDFRGFHFDTMNGDVIFKNCKINGFNAYGGNGTVTFEECTFGNDASHYNGLNIYSNTVIKNSTFVYESGKTNFVDLEADGLTLRITNCKATLDGVDTDIANFVGGSKKANGTVVIE